MSAPDRFREELERWRREVLAPSREAARLHEAADATSSGVPLPDLFTPEDVAADPLGDIGFPGEPPYTRGVYPTMYRGRSWTMRQYAGYASAAESNARYRYLLEQGQTGLSVAFDLPTQLGYDPDHPMASGEVGRVGVSIASLADMELLLEGIPLDRVTTSMTINATAAVLLALYVAVAKRRGIEPRVLRGTLQNDILKEYFARGTYIYPPAASMRLVTDVVAFTTEHMPRWNPVSVSGYHMREAGATAAQEVAFTLADGLAYARAAAARGLEPDAFLPRWSFFFAAQNDLLEEVAKFRAARRLWWRLVTDAFAPEEPRSAALRFHAQTAGVALTAQQPMNNVVRVTVQALAAVLGGAQSLHANAMDEALGLPTEEAATLALRTQQVLAEESGVTQVVDPLGGSYAVEALTTSLEGQAHDLVRRVEEIGGAVAAAESGWVSAQIAESAYRHQRAVERGELGVVGVNRYVEAEDTKPPVLAIDSEVERRRAAEVARLREERDAAAVAAALRRVADDAEGSRNLVAALIGAVEAEATVGEICDVLRLAWGEYRAPQGA